MHFPTILHQLPTFQTFLPPLPCFFKVFRRPSISSGTMSYRRGMVVEVQIHEYGFESSFFRATIVSYSRRDGYKVRFHHLLEENKRDLLTQFAQPEHVRPIPDEPPFHSFAAGDVVDAHVNDGWWVGRVIRPVAEMLLISFPDHHEEMVVKESCVRLHQDYVEDGGIWVYSKV